MDNARRPGPCYTSGGFILAVGQVQHGDSGMEWARATSRAGWVGCVGSSSSMKTSEWLQRISRAQSHDNHPVISILSGTHANHTLDSTRRDAANLTLHRRSDCAACHRYLDLLLAANERMNLTRIESRAAAEIGHVGDALTLLSFLAAGCAPAGGCRERRGVPGLPLAIARPDATVVLVESTQKRRCFLKETAEGAGIEERQRFPRCGRRM